MYVILKQLLFFFTFRYWHIRGRVNPVRMLLHYAGEDFVDKRYSDYNEWFGKDKINLPLDFPNLPYYMDGTVKMTQVSKKKI